MGTINMQCKSISHIHVFMLKVVCLVDHSYVHRRSVDTNLVEIHAEMSNLLDKQVYVLNECFK